MIARQTLINDSSLRTDPDHALRQVSVARETLKALSALYPGFESWFDQKVVPGLTLGTRSLLLEWRDEHLAGAAIVKDDGVEKKLCCLRVSPGFENASGLGVKLFKRAFDVLQTERPALSVSEENREAFDRLFRYFGFEWEADHAGIYRPTKRESAFNGLVLPAPIVVPSVNEAQVLLDVVPSVVRRLRF